MFSQLSPVVEWQSSTKYSSTMLAALVLSLKLWTKFLYRGVRTTLGSMAMYILFGTQPFFTVPVTQFLFAGTVPVTQFLFAGTVPVNNLFLQKMQGHLKQFHLQIAVGHQTNSYIKCAIKKIISISLQKAAPLLIYHFTIFVQFSFQSSLPSLLHLQESLTNIIN